MIISFVIYRGHLGTQGAALPATAMVEQDGQVSRVTVKTVNASDDKGSEGIFKSVAERLGSLPPSTESTDPAKWFPAWYHGSFSNCTTTPISGTYRMKGSTVNVADKGQTQEQSRDGELEVIEQAGGKLNFALEADLRNGEAVFAYNRGKYEQWRITMKVAPDKVELEQTQECGFGTGVDASGTYTKISSEVPNLPKEQ
jgi:hypothetical protein